MRLKDFMDHREAVGQLLPLALQGMGFTLQVSAKASLLLHLHSLVLLRLLVRLLLLLSTGVMLCSLAAVADRLLPLVICQPS